MRKILRKRSHIRRVRYRILELQMEIVNASLNVQHKNPNDVYAQLDLKGNLIRKYERRLALINM